MIFIEFIFFVEPLSFEVHSQRPFHPVWVDGAPSTGHYKTVRRESYKNMEKICLCGTILLLKKYGKAHAVKLTIVDSTRRLPFGGCDDRAQRSEITRPIANRKSRFSSCQRDALFFDIFFIDSVDWFLANCGLCVFARVGASIPPSSNQGFKSIDAVSYLNKRERHTKHQQWL